MADNPIAQAAGNAAAAAASLGASQLPPQVHQFPPIPDPSTNNGYQGTAYGTLRQAQFISVMIGGSSSSVYLGGVTAVSIKEGYEGAGLEAFMGTFRQESKLGVNRFTGSITRRMPKGQTFKQLVRQAYAMKSGSYVRLDMLPLTVGIYYIEVGASFNYSAAFDKSNWLYGEAIFNEAGFDANLGEFVQETLSFYGQAEQINDGAIQLVTQPAPQALYAALP